MTCSQFPTPSSYRNALADRIREQLLDIYGRKCSHCGASADDTHLEINHKFPRNWTIRSINRYRRYLRYFKEAQLGHVNLLCRSCNSNWRPNPNEQPPGYCNQFKAWLSGNKPF